MNLAPKYHRFLAVTAFAILAIQSPAGTPTRQERRSAESPLRQAAGASLSSDYGKLPLAFEPNMGQTDARVRFLARGGGMTTFFTDTETVMVLSRCRQATQPKALGRPDPAAGEVEQAVVRMKPVVASLNAPTGTVVANAAIVKAGASGSIDIFASDSTDLVIDVNGYFAPMGTGGLSLYGVTPCRVVDTRQPAGSPAITSLDVAVSASVCGIPASAQAHVLSVTVVPPASLGYLTLWPQGQTRPLVSTLNALDGAITSNLAIVPTTNGSISAFASNATHLILDISGYFGQ